MPVLSFIINVIIIIVVVVVVIVVVVNIIIIIIIIIIFLYFLSQTNIITDQELHQIFKVPLLGLREPRDIMRKPQHNQH